METCKFNDGIPCSAEECLGRAEASLDDMKRVNAAMVAVTCREQQASLDGGQNAYDEALKALRAMEEVVGVVQQVRQCAQAQL